MLLLQGQAEIKAVVVVGVILVPGGAAARVEGAAGRAPAAARKLHPQLNNWMQSLTPMSRKSTET